MDDRLTVSDLQQRWEHALNETKTAVSRHPTAYLELKTLAAEIVRTPLDIGEYLPTAKKLAALIHTLDPGGRGSIFFHFTDGIAPSSVWQVAQLRLACKDLLNHLDAFDRWRRDACRLRVLK